jgi:hypothetical protein
MPTLRFLVTYTVVLSLPFLAFAETPAVVIDAADLATPEQRADKPTTGKWWLKRDANDWGTPKGNILLTGEPSDKPNAQGEWVTAAAHRFVPYRVPNLVVDPKVKGWHRIYLGMFHQNLDAYARPLLYARISGEPYPEYIGTPANTQGKTAEVYWKPVDLTGKRIQIEQPPGPMPHTGFGYLGGISYIKLVPMTEAEVTAAKQEIELPPAKQRLFGMLDSTDEIFWWSTIETEDDVRAIIYRHRETGFGRVYWRAFGSHLDTSNEVPEANARWTDENEQAWIKAQHTKTGWMPYLNLPKKFDPLKVAVEYGKKNDCEVHAWVRMTNFNRAPYANFWHDHPEYRAQMIAHTTDPKTGKFMPIKPYKYSPYARVLSLAYPEVRAFYVKFFKQLASTGTKGIMIDLLRHPPICGYEPIVSEAFKKKYGKDMEEFDVYHDPLVNEFISEYLRLFLVDLRKEIGNDIEISVRSSGPSKYALRGKEWIDAGLINTIVDGNWYSGNGPRPTIEETIKACGTKGHPFAIAETLDVDPKKYWQRRKGDLSPEAILALSKIYSDKGAENFGIYESTVFTWQPELRRAIREAGWKYVGKKK